MRALLQAVWLALLVAILPAGASDAFAHAALIRTEPADSAVLARAPAEFRLTFNEPVSPLLMRLVTPSGLVMPLTRVTGDGPSLVVAMPDTRGEGSYVLSWRVTSEDGHPVGGTVLFSIGAPSTAAPPVENSNPLVRTAIWLTRLMLFVGMFAGVGGAVFGGLVAPLPRLAARSAGIVLAIGAIAAIGSLGLQGIDALGGSLGAFTEVATWRAGVSTVYSTTAWLALFGCVLGLLSFAHPIPQRVRVALCWLALTCVGIALASSGHAASASPRWLTVPAVFVHAAGLTFWLGALLPLAMLLPSADSAMALARFSRLIRFAVAGVLVSGLVLGTVQLGWPGTAWISPYGAVLLGKLVLLAALFALAAYNRFRLTTPVLAGDSRAAASMRRIVVAEIAVAMVILAVVALWRFTPPPRALAEAAAAPAYVHIHTAAAMADLTVKPGRAGPVGVSMVLQNDEFGPLAAKEVMLELSNPALGIEPIERPARRTGDANWQVDGLAIPASGRWQVKVEVLVTDFDRLTLEGALDIAR